MTISFKPGQVINVFEPASLVVTDVNGDFNPDIVVASLGRVGPDTVTVLLGNGLGGFTTGETESVGTGNSILAVGDVNGDGTPDIVASSVGNGLDDNGNIDVLLSGATGYSLTGPYDSGSHPGAVMIADINGDGHPDIVFEAGSQTQALINDGAGGFAASPVLLSALPATVADAAGDGHPDLIATDPSAGTVSVAAGNGAGAFASPVSYAAGTAPSRVAVADINDDGRPDLVVFGATGGVSVLLGEPGGFAAPNTTNTGTAFGAYAIGDVTGDGIPDLVAVTGAGAISVLRGDGAGGFAAPVAIATASQVEEIALADVNGDGKLDIVFDQALGPVSILLNTGTAAPCFCAGTLIRTDRGDMPVERIEAGDTLCLAGGGRAQVRWTGHRRQTDATVIRLRTGCLGGVPTRDLLVSDDHAIEIKGALVPAGLLVNGDTIVRETWPVAIFHHVELEAHAVLLAEGAPTESYLDTGNRARFANCPLGYDPAEAAHDPCAEILFGGPRLDAIRARLPVSVAV
jgi:hypothetical protein